MPSNVKEWVNDHAPFLLKEGMPVWLTIIASVIAAITAAVGTYYIAPAINRQYKIDEARSTHVADTTQKLNEEIITLSQKVRRLNDSLVNETADAATLRQESLDQITKLQWMLVDLNVILKSEDDRAAVEKLAAAIARVKDALDQSVDARAQPRLLVSMRDLGEATRDVLDRLYGVAALK
jgi:hypothetical protein